MTTQNGYFVQEIDTDLASRGFGELGQFTILDQGNEVPDEFSGCGPNLASSLERWQPGPQVIGSAAAAGQQRWI